MRFWLDLRVTVAAMIQSMLSSTIGPMTVETCKIVLENSSHARTGQNITIYSGQNFHTSVQSHGENSLKSANIPNALMTIF